MSLDDQAQAHEAQEWSIRNRPREVVTYKPGEPGYGPVECERCETDMHPVRRAHGFKLCTSCQSAIEIAGWRMRRY